MYRYLYIYIYIEVQYGNAASAGKAGRKCVTFKWPKDGKIWDIYMYVNIYI